MTERGERQCEFILPPLFAFRIPGNARESLPMVSIFVALAAPSWVFVERHPGSFVGDETMLSQNTSGLGYFSLILVTSVLPDSFGRSLCAETE